jgi:2-iminobutanoate/2-iminopropanoate deaminase
MPMKTYSPPGVHEPSAYSHAIEIAPGMRTIHISGQVGVSPDGRLLPDFPGQCQQALENLAAVLKAAGMGLEDLVKVNSYLVRRGDLEAYRGIRARFYGGLRPASTLLIVAGLAREGGLIEIEAVAAKA